MKTVIIIGAGPAGLTAAYDLKKQRGDDLRVILLEESGEIGGISRTVRHNGCRIDLGGHRFFSKNEQVNALWQEIMPMQGAPSMCSLKSAALPRAMRSTLCTGRP